MVFKACGRLMHRIGHPAHHALRSKPGLIDNLLADGITIMQPVSGQPT